MARSQRRTPIISITTSASEKQDNFKALMDAAGPSSMDSSTQRLPDLHHYAQLLTAIAAGIQDGTITGGNDANWDAD